MHEQHEKGTTKIHYKTIIQDIESYQDRISDIFKVTRKGITQKHPLYNKLILHEKGFYWIDLPSEFIKK